MRHVGHVVLEVQPQLHPFFGRALAQLDANEDRDDEDK